MYKLSDLLLDERAYTYITFVAVYRGPDRSRKLPSASQIDVSPLEKIDFDGWKESRIRVVASYSAKSRLSRGLFLCLRNVKTIDNSVERPHCREEKGRRTAGPPFLSFSPFGRSFQTGECAAKKLL